MENKKPVTILKIGGNIIDNPTELSQFLSDFSKIEGYKILVHGGGKSATKMAESIGLVPQMIDGRRITDAAMLDVVVMIYAGQINKSIVAQLQANSTNAMGFSGADGNLIQSEKRNHPTINYGFVGDVKKVNTKLLETLLSNGIVPVFCAITHDGKGQLLNTNADTIASELAIALSEVFDVTLNYCFEKPGVLYDAEDDSSVISTINQELYSKLKAEKAIHSGMIPKLDNCFNSLSKGVQKIKIGHHRMLQDKTALYTSIEL
ncbi:acetylglutamate kinase [Flavobacterium gawalongense]|uniref:Acetylglutamate kinase n=1 Tax=Flavobacterium gawalongense TaxID=2594432 RepID=A0A553BIY2_9FLAO|nr:acetylglutamate kinase [Flavobacterium gawalongense]TRX00107.1 acetylglutamate kinase [Flavobacterium gawalongense]TRX04800.1 acetylglutamate kinase [Flavobacterium gawalongense]TRX08205.1 acetylglutamate kinase [Flavobacterium gawalongense]TRX08779.1 acetylglutamate kinase [Flavobacterium gawalongense]TRX24707.1 acetylglutamate kinase [Flavobacterium gawalongense]